MVGQKTSDFSIAIRRMPIFFVRKRCYGINWSFNWGNPWTWGIVGTFVVAMVLIGILC